MDEKQNLLKFGKRLKEIRLFSIAKALNITLEEFFKKCNYSLKKDL